MTQTSMCWTGEDHLWESKSIYMSKPKRASNKSNNLICRPDSARKRKMHKMLLWDFWRFPVSVALTRRLRFLRFWGFQFTLQFTRWTAVFEVLSFNRTDKAFEIFLSNGDSGYYNTIRRVPSRWPPRSGHHPPKALRILVRIPSPCQGTKCPSCCMR